MSHSLLGLLDKDSSGGSDNNVSELERDLLLAFEEQESSSLVSPLAPYVLLVALLSHLTLRLIKNIAKVELVSADQKD
jgi:hypothetical protein